MQAMRESLSVTRPGASLNAVDSSFSAPARFLADDFERVPGCKDPEFSNCLLDICQRQSVGLVIPTIDTELPAFAGMKDSFSDRGITLCVSGRETIEIAGDKNRTHQWLIENDLPTVRQAIVTDVFPGDGWRWPLIVKPYNGSASSGIAILDDPTELTHFAKKHPDYIAQEIARGKEFTINVYVNRHGKCVCAVPHWRIAVRAGEVSKGITVRNEKLMELARRAAEALPDARGPLNLQCFLDEEGTIAIIEINARFGGGYPLAHRAGARFTDWLLAEQEDREVGYFDSWTDNLAMLRYDAAVFMTGDQLFP
jgi:carbamoyl-phosphate synthase large subunit